MAIYGYVRCSLLKWERSPKVQSAVMARRAEELGGSLTRVFVDPGSPGKETAVLKRPAGKEMLEALQAGDILIVNRLDRLGYSMGDIRRTVGALGKREVTIHVLDAPDGEFDVSPGKGSVIRHVITWLAKTEKVLRSERATESAQWRKENGLAYGGVPKGKKIVERDGAKVLEWDMEQLGYIAEIAKRLPREGPARVAKDFWKRGVKDRRGRLWGQQTPRNGMISMLSRLVGTHYTPYQQFYRAALWFHRMKRKGLLPLPYGKLALSMQEPKSFREEPKPRKSTPGGTARREQERAEAKARHRAERLAKWRKERAMRVQSRVHKPKLELQPEEGAAGT